MWKQLAIGALDALLPPSCPGCGEALDRQGGVCPACYRNIRLIGEPCCVGCGIPFETGPAGAIHCARCVARPFAFSKARAGFVYDGMGRELIRSLKYRDDDTVLASLIGLAYPAWLALSPEDALVVPVPMHRRRLWRRRYNQAALIARALHRRFGAEVAMQGLARVRPTRQQTGLSDKARRRNVRGAFQVRAPERVTGRTVLLIDDVMTTGATLHACAEVLLTAGAAEVRCFTLGRTVLQG